jgi:coniferyl-aldehyde dehydrogenase
MTDVVRTAPAIDPSPAEMHGLLYAQRAAFLAEGPPTADVRRNRIDRLTVALLAHADELTAALSSDFGNRPEFVTLTSDLLGSLADVHLVSEHLAEWMQDVEVPEAAAKGMPTFVQQRPKGVVGIIGPWNFPVNLVFQPAVEALAAGNRVMIKFSEISYRTAEVFATAVAKYMTPEEVVVVRGGPQTAAAFSSLPFDHLFFTGSPAVGRHVAAAAANNLVPVTLELGGKNPVVVGPDADLAVVAERVAAQRLLNGGQVCLCPDYVFVPSSDVDEFVDGYRASVEKFFPTYRDNPDVVSVVNDAHYTRITGLLEDAREKGATVVPLIGDDELAALPDPATRRIPPILLLGVTEEMTIAEEEVFGPVLTVYPYDAVDHVIDYVNSRPSPLAAYWYGSDSPEYREFIRRTTSGGLTRNDMALHFGIEGTPFGGVGQSGNGAYHGRVGFDTFSHKRTITANELPFGVAPRSMPPYTPARVARLRENLESELSRFQANLSGGS